MYKSLGVSLLAAVTLAACQPTTEASVAASDASLSIVDQVAAATCASPAPPRDDWLRTERPPVDEVRASYIERGFDPAESGVFKAYAAFMEAGQNHAAAAAVYGSGYPERAACFS